MMHALRPSSIFRPSSRPSSPVPGGTSARSESAPPVDRARPMTKLSSLTFSRRPSPSPAVSATPAPAIVQDGSYLEVLSLKLSEMVSKSLMAPTVPAATGSSDILNGRRPIPAGRGRALGALIETEINASKENPHLRKAVLRTLQRPLSTCLTTLSSHLLPLLSSPTFSASISISSAPGASPFNATQIHALSLATFAGELLEAFDRIGLGHDDGLRSVRENLASVLSRVMNPLVASIRNDILPLIVAVEETPAPAAPSPSTKTPSRVLHPSIAALQTSMPSYTRALVRLFSIPTTDGTLATLDIALVWRALVALAHRQPPESSPPGSPQPLGLVPTVSRKRRSVTPPNTPPAAKFIAKLPGPLSRPPSPTVPKLSPHAVDARALLDILSTLPRPSPDSLARDAVDDAFSALRELVGLLEADLGSMRSGDASALAQQLTSRTGETPTLVALPVLMHVLRPGKTRSVARMLGLEEAEYRRGCLAGFGRAEECVPSVGRRALEVLKREGGEDALVMWLDAEVKAAVDDANATR
ncbi:unnamed protein product [Peniophora sp. CBMAI 1063]|nr:unnamed protein product [Peniophora sp. CBMAI 1063]